MKCDRCDNESTVHEVTLKNGVKVEKHLCESCARQEGIAVSPGVPISDLITKFVVAQASGSKTAPKPRAQACPGCGVTFAEFRQSGLLGCAACYSAFESSLAPLIERAHEGATHHVGKTPRRAGAGSPGAAPGGGAPAPVDAGEERARRLRQLQQQLDEAVKGEQYERAARLRDELKKMSVPGGPGPGFGTGLGPGIGGSGSGGEPSRGPSN